MYYLELVWHYLLGGDVDAPYGSMPSVPASQLPMYLAHLGTASVNRIKKMAIAYLT